MLGKNRIRKFVTLITVAAVWCVYSTVAFAVPVAATGEITVTGQVTVNGQPAISSSTVVSGATIVTGANSSALVSLGKLGRVEVLADSSMTLQFSDTSINATLDSGKARLSNGVGIATTVATKHAMVLADSAQANNFAVEVECSHTHVDTTSGIVTMRQGTNDKQIVAGTTAVAGSLVQTGCKPCLRPDSGPGVSIAGWPWLILVAAGIIGAGVLLGQDNDTGTDGGVIILSPNR